MLDPRLKQGIRVANELGLQTGLRSMARSVAPVKVTQRAVRDDIAYTLSLMNPRAEDAFPYFAKEIKLLKEARDTVVSLTPAGLANDIVTLIKEE